jgi:hypothetical protein
MTTLTVGERSKFMHMLRVFGAALASTAHWRFGDEPLPPDPAAQRGGARLLVELFGVSGARRLFEYERRSDGAVLVRPGRRDCGEEELDVIRGMQGILWLTCAAVDGDHEVRETLGVWPGVTA